MLPYYQACLHQFCYKNRFTNTEYLFNMFFLETSVPTSEPACAMTYNINSVESSSVTDMFEEDNFDLLTQSSELPGPSVPEVPIANCNPPPAAKKRKVSTQDIQKMQLEVLALEKKKN